MPTSYRNTMFAGPPSDDVVAAGVAAPPAAARPLDRDQIELPFGFAGEGLEDPVLGGGMAVGGQGEPPITDERGGLGVEPAHGGPP